MALARWLQLYLNAELALGQGIGTGLAGLTNGDVIRQGSVELARALEVKAGKLAASDDFDQNRYANSTRTQFMNWGLWNSSAWDFAADTRGYSWGLVIAWVRPTLGGPPRVVHDADVRERERVRRRRRARAGRQPAADVAPRCARTS